LPESAFKCVYNQLFHILIPRCQIPIWQNN